jgi:hypothetical protein
VVATAVVVVKVYAVEGVTEPVMGVGKRRERAVRDYSCPNSHETSRITGVR